MQKHFLLIPILTCLSLVGCESSPKWSDASPQVAANSHGEFVAIGDRNHLSLPPRKAGIFYFLENDTGKVIYAIHRSAESKATDISKTPEALRTSLADKKQYLVYFRPD